MKRTNTDFIVGGVIFLALFLLIAGVLWLKEVSISRSLVSYTIVFPNIGTLQKGDPVTVNGVKRGSVSKMYFHRSQVAVEIKLDKAINFSDSSRVTIQNIGLMGERMVGIQLSEQGKRHRPDTKDTVRFIQGYFDSGIAEAMGMLGTVLSDVVTLIDTVHIVLKETVGDHQFIGQLRRITERLDTITVQARNVIQSNEQTISTTIKNLQTLSVNIRSLLDSNNNHIHSIIKNGDKLTTNAVSVIQRIDSISNSLHVMTKAIDQGKGTIGMLAKDDKMAGSINQSMQRLDSLVKDIKTNGLKLRVRLNLFNNSKSSSK